jgi:diguanylate cyclase (GGDEF)-like protein
MLKDVLLEEEYNVEVAPDGLVAEQKLIEFAPDLVLLDLNVPHRTGEELLREIRKKDQEHGVFIPVIVLTGVYTTRNDKIDYLNRGADDFLPKPFDLIELLARVRSLLRLREMYKRSQYLATHDHLTRCYNRRYLTDFLDREVARFKRYKQPFTFLMLDLDHFKQINDQFGHEGGDQVLLHIGFRLQDFFRAVDCVARLGGDEFAAVLPDCGAEEALKVADRLVKTLAEPAAKEGLSPEIAKMVSFSVGVACMPAHTNDKDELIRLADEAMYAAKKAGRNQAKIAPLKK